MSHEPPDLRFRIYAFFLFFIVGSALWGGYELLRYFITGKTPSVSEIPWLIGWYIVIWIGGEIWDHFKWNQERIKQIESRLDALEKRNPNSN